MVGITVFYITVETLNGELNPTTATSPGQIFPQQLRKNTVKVFEEMTKLRIELSLAEAAVEGGKKQHDAAVNELESELKHCQQELCILEAEVGDITRKALQATENGTK